MLAATLFTAIGFCFLLNSTGAFWHFAVMTASAGASFGAAVGSMVGRTSRFAAYGWGMGILFFIYAAAT